MFASLLVLSAAFAWAPACPIAATSQLADLVGSWQVIQVMGLDRPRPDSLLAAATIGADLQDCLLRERLVAQRGNPPYEALILWGVNGADSTVQRFFTHSQHGAFGVYQGRRTQNEMALRQVEFGGNPPNVVVENRVVIADRDHFSISSRLSNDSGQTWQLLSRTEYRRSS